MLKIRVLFASLYAVTDEQTGKLNEGVSLQYQTLEPSGNRNQVGTQVVKGSLPKESWPLFIGREYPMMAECDFTISTAANRSVVKLTGIRTPALKS